MKLYLLDWKNGDWKTGMIGGFHGEDLHQIFNTSKGTLLNSIEDAMETYGVKSFEIEIIHSHEELNKMRKDRGLDICGVL